MNGGGGRGVCKHGKQRYFCLDCGGKGICTHGIERRNCDECGGSGRCPHGRVKYFCKDCGGTGICEHGRQRAWCRDCGVDTGELAAHYSEKRKGYKRDYRLRQKEKERRNSSRSPSPEDVCEPIGLPMQPTPTAVAPKRVSSLQGYPAACSRPCTQSTFHRNTAITKFGSKPQRLQKH